MSQRRQLEGLTRRLKSVLRKAHRDIEEEQPELETRRFVHDLAMARTELEAKDHELLLARDELLDAADELTEARAAYRQLYDSAPVGFLSLDRRGSIVDANVLAGALLGADVARLLGRPLAAFCTERAADTLGHHLRAAFEGTQQPSCEIDVRNGADSTRALRLESRVDRKGYWCWTALIDVTEQKRQIEQAQRMQAIGTFASQVAHDFNNLLTGMIGCADLALARLPEGSDAVRYLDALKSAGYSGGAIVSRLMEFGRARAESARPVDINALIARRETLLARLMGPDVQLRLGLGPSVAPALCDPAEIEQVLMNLAVNARQAMPQGGRLTLETAESVVTGAGSGRSTRLPAGRYVTIVVSDTGCGIDAETQNRIFEPFFTTKAPDRGTGLGLSTVHEIISRLGGAIEVESEPGAGTTFTVYLPWADGMVGGELEQPSIGGQRGDETVLLVEDEPLVRISVAHYLRRHGYQVLESSVDDAMAVLRDGSQTVDLLLTGVVLSGVTGPHLAELGRASRPSLRVLFMSADSQEAGAAEARVGPDALVLEKPFTEADIISKVRAVLRGTSRPPSPEAPPGIDVSVMRNEQPRRSLLVVEGDSLARAAMGELLQDRGYRVWTVGTAADAQRAWQEHSGAFDAVVTDIQLPDVSGITFLSWIREQRPTIAIVVITGHSAEHPVFDGLRSESRTIVVQKPIDAARLAETVYELASS